MPVAKIDKDEAIVAIAELFREHGYHGTTYSQIIEVSGLGKGSLYNYFPGGKEDIAKAVLKHIDNWFQINVFAPLDTNDAPEKALGKMFSTVSDYFANGQRICLLGAFALYDSKAPFAQEIKSYFQRWIKALVNYLIKQGLPEEQSRHLALSAMVAIQGGLVMAQATDDKKIFTLAMVDAQNLLLTSILK